MHRDRRAGPRHARSIKELSVLLEDALSAAAGWTVIPPDNYPVASSIGGPNWSVDLRSLDSRMLGALQKLQDPYELETKRPGGFQTLLGFLATGMRSRHSLRRAGGCHPR